MVVKPMPSLLKKENGLIKIITGIRRCGKSYLHNSLFKEYLGSIGIKGNHIIKLDLDVINLFLILLLLYILGYVFGYRKGHFDDKAIRIIYKFLPRGDKNKEAEE